MYTACERSRFEQIREEQNYKVQNYSTIALKPICLNKSTLLKYSFFFFVFREDETDLVFPKDEFQPLSTLYPPAVPE